MRSPGSRFLVPPKHWGVQTRLSAVSTISAVVGLAAAASVAYFVTSRTLHQQIDESLRGAPGAITPAQQRQLPTAEELCRSLTAPVTPSPGLFTVVVIDADGTVCNSASGDEIRLVQSDYEVAETGGESQLRDGNLGDGSPARVAIAPLPTGGALVIARDVTSVRSVLATLAGTLVLVVLLGAISALVLSRWTSKAGLRPIARFADVAEDIANTGKIDGHLPAATDTQAAGRPGDELDRLSRAFASMTVVLADAQARQRRLVADAGHELRTPLTSLRANIALLTKSRRLHRPLPPVDEDRLLEDLSRQTTELSSLVDDLAQLATDDHTEPAVEVLRFDLCVERALKRAARRATATGHQFDISLDPWVVEGDEAGLQRAVVNLLDNAIKFSPEQSVITVNLRRGTLTITDVGAGIDDDDARRAFERFWRAPRARSLPGSGLGLSIVDEVARRHHGWAQIAKAQDGRGTSASMFIPGFDNDDPPDGQPLPGREVPLAPLAAPTAGVEPEPETAPHQDDDLGSG